MTTLHFLCPQWPERRSGNDTLGIASGFAPDQPFNLGLDRTPTFEDATGFAIPPQGIRQSDQQSRHLLFWTTTVKV